MYLWFFERIAFQEIVAGKRVENALAKLETTMKRTPVKIPGRALQLNFPKHG